MGPEQVTALGLGLGLGAGCAPDGWGTELATPDRAPAAGEQAWSNLMDPAQEAKALAEEA